MVDPVLGPAVEGVDRDILVLSRFEQRLLRSFRREGRIEIELVLRRDGVNQGFVGALDEEPDREGELQRASDQEDYPADVTAIDRLGRLEGVDYHCEDDKAQTLDLGGDERRVTVKLIRVMIVVWP